MVEKMVPPPRLERGTPRSTISGKHSDFSAILQYAAVLGIAVWGLAALISWAAGS